MVCHAVRSRALSENDLNDNDLPAEPEALPLDGWHRGRGGRMVDFAGYWLPVQYDREGGGIMAEHLWTRAHAGLFDVSHMGQLVVSGDGAIAALEAVLPADIAGMVPGQVRYLLLLDEDGGILDDLMVTRRGGDFLLVVNGATKWDDMGHLREHLPDEITLNYLDEQALLALQGPQAAAALAALNLRAAEAEGPMLTALSFMQAGAFWWGDVPLWVSRTGYTGEDGFEISVPAEEADALADALCEAPDVRPIGLGARDSLRLEAGLPLYGHDLSPETEPFGAGLGFAIARRRRAEAGFIGAEAVLGVLAKGPVRKRVGLVPEGRMAAREGTAVVAGGKDVGRVTSGGFSPSLGHPVAMAWVEAAHAAPGTELVLDIRGKAVPARVVPLPFVPHRYVRLETV